MPARWQLRQMFRANGAHLPKREKAVLYSYQPTVFERDLHKRRDGFIPFEDKPVPGNLANDQYRYFQGCRAPHATYSQCRTCRESFNGSIERAAHVKSSGCLQHFNDAITIWVGKQRRYSIITQPCAVCAKKSLYRKWGIPLCNNVRCIERWMFDVVAPDDLRTIIAGILHA
jgi:hypothetical protein